MEENLIMIRHPKTFYYNFDNLKHENEFIIKRNESLVENKIKSEIEQLLFKYKLGNNILEHRKRSSNKSMLFLKTYVFITRGKIYENSTRTINLK